MRTDAKKDAFLLRETKDADPLPRKIATLAPRSAAIDFFFGDKIIERYDSCCHRRSPR